MSIPARVSIITLGVSDLERSRAFYLKWGWKEVSSSVPGEISWFKTAETYVGLFDYTSLAEDGEMKPGSREGFCGVTLAINMESDDAVRAAFEAAVAAGATVFKEPKPAIFDGLSAYVGDPDGYPWELAHNPHFPIGDDGRTTIP